MSTAHHLAGNTDITGVHPVAGLLPPGPDRAGLPERRVPDLNSIACSNWYLEIIFCGKIPPHPLLVEGEANMRGMMETMELLQVRKPAPAT